MKTGVRDQGSGIKGHINRHSNMLTWLKPYFYIFILFTFHFSLLAEVHAQESQTVTSEGIAPIVEGNTAIARDNAIGDAMRKAVEQAVGTMVSSETVIQNFQMLSDKIYSQSQGYIQSYKILSEGAVDPTIYKVTVQAVVSIGGLKDDLAALGLLMQRKGMPRVLFMIAEQNIGRQYYIFWWSFWGSKAEFMAQQGDMGVAEQTLTERFLEKGFNIVDHNVQERKIKLSPSFGVVDLTDNAAKTIGSELDAEIVIYGKANAKLVGGVMGSGILSSQANISVKAVRIDTGGVIASASASGAAVHSDEVTAGNKAIEKVSSELAEKLIDQIARKWGQEVSGSALVQMVVSGISNYADFVKFKNAVQGKVRGVQALYQRSIAGGVATVDVDIKGSAQSLADEISAIDFKEFTVNITDVSSNRIELTLSPKK
jgi:hypothetical protein